MDRPSPIPPDAAALAGTGTGAAGAAPAGLQVPLLQARGQQQQTQAGSSWWRWWPWPRRQQAQPQQPQQLPDDRLVKPSDLDLPPGAMDRFKTLLSLDGGGMRGLMTAVVLERLELIIKMVMLEDGLLSKAAKARLHLDGHTPGYYDLHRAHLYNDAGKFEVQLGDWFDMVAGTSTGGLLAIYLAARAQYRDRQAAGTAAPVLPAAGSAAGAIAMYEVRGSEIFPTWRRIIKAKQGLFKVAHPADGLRRVLGDALTQDGKEMTLADLKTDAVICSVDAAHVRSAFFFRLGKLGDAAELTGFGTHARQTGKPNEVLCRDNTIASNELCLGPLATRDPADRNGPETPIWTVPVAFMPSDFKLAAIARATSAAPGYLPPCYAGDIGDSRAEIAPLPDDVPAGGRKNTYLWEKDAVFVDGGLANNDPSTVALSMLLLRNPTVGIKNTAVLSIGCGQALDCPTYGSGTILTLLPDVINLAMGANGEDKSTFLRLMYQGLLRLPEEQFLRAQLYMDHLGVTAADPGVHHRAQTIRDYFKRWREDPPEGQAQQQQQEQAPTRQEKRAKAAEAAVTKSREDRTSLTVGPEPSQTLTVNKGERDALAALDDPSEGALDAYNKAGIFLADFYHADLESFVRCYCFGLEQAASGASTAAGAAGRATGGASS